MHSTPLTSAPAVAAPPLVTMTNVAKTYRSKRGDVAALEGINLAIGNSEFLSVLGPSG